MLDTHMSTNSCRLDPSLLKAFRSHLEKDGVAVRLHCYYEGRVLEWMERHRQTDPGMDPARSFSNALEREGVPDWQCRQAYQAVRLWEELEDEEQELALLEKVPEVVVVRSWDEVLSTMDDRMRQQRYSPRTRESYLDWGRRLAQMSPEVPTDSESASLLAQSFLRQMALGRNLSPASISQARNALAWLVRRELKLDLVLEAKGDAHKGKRLPKVIAPEQVGLLLKACKAPWDLFFSLQYGCGLRLMEILDLRVQEVDLSRGLLQVRHGKGDKDRRIPLPRKLQEAMESHLNKRRAQWESDRELGLAEVELPNALARKLGEQAATSWDWQHVFGSTRPLKHPETGRMRRFRPLESLVREVLRDAALAAGLDGRVHPHLLRHCYATHLLEAGVALKNIQELMGHARLETTMIYMHVRSGAFLPTSPLDRI
jgi:site-specific recombinase XerD